MALSQSRTVTPVVPITSRPTPPIKGSKKTVESADTVAARPKSVVEMPDDAGVIHLIDTISGTEWVDSVGLQQKLKEHAYPLMDAISIGVDIWPAIDRAFGYRQGVAGIWARLSLHNRFFPVLELGMSNAYSKPAQMNYTYKSGLAPYFKIGMDYNIIYNNDSKYQLYALVRYGLSHFSYSIQDVTINEGYWQESDQVSIPIQKSTTGYLELGAGMVVNLWGPLSAGWNIKYHRVLHHSAEKYGSPWNVPGYGVRTSALGVQVSLIYTIPFHEPIIINEKETKSTNIL